MTDKRDIPKLENYEPSRFMLPTPHYDKAKADRAVRFIENLKHTKGKWAGKRFYLLPWQEQIVGIFGLADEFTRLCVTAIRIITCGFLFAGVNVLLQGVCQALGGGVQSLVISALRLIVIVLPVSAVLAQFAGAEKLVWIAFPAAEALSFAVAVILTVRLYCRTKVDIKLSMGMNNTEL